MGIIRTLSRSVVNQIAAGEVIERPASVVKELLENAIDAGARRIDVTVERGGKDLVRVADSGQGMAPDDLPLAFQPHATSKLSEADDLFRIATLGFRGEALAAIAEVSKLRCQTRQADAVQGSEITIEGGEASEIRACGCPPGTVMEVRNLFYNTPVRRTFLKSDSTEAGHVVDTFMRVALAHPTVHLTFRSGGKMVYDLPAATGIKQRVVVFFGQELADSLLWVESRIESVHLWGYVAHPAQSRSNAKGQFLFVGGRFVRDRSLGHALSEAYRGLLMVGRQPVAFLHLDLPAEEVDVNVHPTKVEVRFRDSQRIYSQLFSTLRNTFLSSDLHSHLQAPEPARKGPSSGAEEPAPAGRAATASAATAAAEPFALAAPAPVPNRQTVAAWFSGDRAGGGVASREAAPEWAAALETGPRARSGDAFDEFATPATLAFAPDPVPAAAAPQPAPTGALGGPAEPGLFAVNDPTALAPQPDETPVPLAGPLKALQLHDSYLVAETSDGMMVIDQHALHERILYEELRSRVEQGGVESQRLLVPDPVHLTAAEAALVLEQREVLLDLGLEVEPFGGDTVLVVSTPAMLPALAPERLLRDLVEQLRSKPLPPTRDALLADLLHMVACKAAVKAGQRLTALEIAALLERRHLVADAHHCPHGRPTALVFTKSDLERQFGRI
jgi:DNA mismatch repair protein MutL